MPRTATERFLVRLGCDREEFLREHFAAAWGSYERLTSLCTAGRVRAWRERCVAARRLGPVARVLDMEMQRSLCAGIVWLFSARGARWTPSGPVLAVSLLVTLGTPALAQDFGEESGRIFSIVRMDPSSTALYGPMGAYRYAVEARAGFFKERGIMERARS